jgi:hypothetical protein
MTFSLFGAKPEAICMHILPLNLGDAAGTPEKIDGTGPDTHREA